MDFETALIRYRDGSCTEEERLLVEAELKKSQLIAEYLDGQWEDCMTEQETSQEEFRKVKNGLRRRNVMTILTSLILVLAILAGIVKFVIPVVEAQYWDPSIASYSDEFTDLEFTLRTYSELFIPNQNVCDVEAVKTGFAAYDLSISLREQYNRNRYIHHNTSLVQGELTLPEGIWDYPEAGNFHLDADAEGSYYFTTAEESLKKLPDYVTVRAYVTFPEDLDMEGFMSLFRRVGSAERETPGQINWIGVRVQTDGEDIYPLCGMKPFYANDNGRLGDINAFYPCFSVFGLKEPMGSSAAVTEHFKSLLQYSIDQVDQGTGILPESSLGEAYYQTALNYVEENGVYTYGCSMTATPQQFLDLMHDGTISTVFIQDAWIRF